MDSEPEQAIEFYPRFLCGDGIFLETRKLPLPLKFIVEILDVSIVSIFQEVGSRKKNCSVVYVKTDEN